MGIRVGNTLVVSAAELRGDPRQGVKPWDVAGIAVRPSPGGPTQVFMMNANEARSIIALLERALDEAPPEVEDEP